MADMSEPFAGTGQNGSGFIVYTTMEGGPFHVIRGTRADYDRIVETGEVRIIMFNDADAIINDPIYTAYLCVVESNHDSIIGGSREAA